MPISPISKPNSAAPSSVRCTCALSSSSLAGMQPTLQAGAAELALLDDGDVEPGRRAVQRRGVAAGTATDDDDVEVLLLAVDLAAGVALHGGGDVLGLGRLLGLHRRRRLGCCVLGHLGLLVGLGLRLHRRRRLGLLAAEGAAPSSPMRASTVPTSTVSPSATRISVSVPLIGDGTSLSTLSVDTSNSGSSSAIESPTCLNQRVIVPSVTVSPSWGMGTSATVEP